MTPDAPRSLVLETSGRRGQVALAQGDSLLHVRHLDEARRHARDLAPMVQELLNQARWLPREIDAVILSQGPGSYTGLRVGAISAKTFAYATGCAILSVETFAAIAWQVPPAVEEVEVIADAQQNKIYAQRFKRAGPGGWDPVGSLGIVPLEDWLRRGHARGWITGPGLHLHGKRISDSMSIVDPSTWDPRAESILRLGLARFRAGQHDELWRVEPLYFRPSSAEEKLAARDPS